MEQHPIPREITSFEFKLIGFMTLHQFLYFIGAFPVAFVVYLIPPPPLNIIVGLIPIGIAAVFAFFRYNDRPVEYILRSFWKRINSPSQYLYHKRSQPLAFLQDLYYLRDPHIAVEHAMTIEMLEKYANQQQMQKKAVLQPQKKPVLNTGTPVALQLKTDTTTQSHAISEIAVPTQITPSAIKLDETVKPYISGTVYNIRKIPLPGILVYIKQNTNTPLRILKTNQHGVFGSYHPLPGGEYSIECKDPTQEYFFDIVTLKVTQSQRVLVEIVSRASL